MTIPGDTQNPVTGASSFPASTPQARAPFGGLMKELGFRIVGGQSSGASLAIEAPHRAEFRNVYKKYGHGGFLFLLALHPAVLLAKKDNPDANVSSVEIRFSKGSELVEKAGSFVSQARLKSKGPKHLSVEASLYNKTPEISGQEKTATLKVKFDTSAKPANLVKASLGVIFDPATIQELYEPISYDSPYDEFMGFSRSADGSHYFFDPSAGTRSVTPSSYSEEELCSFADAVLGYAAYMDEEVNEGSNIVMGTLKLRFINPGLSLDPKQVLSAPKPRVLDKEGKKIFLATDIYAGNQKIASVEGIAFKI